MSKLKNTDPHRHKQQPAAAAGKCLVLLKICRGEEGGAGSSWQLAGEGRDRGGGSQAGEGRVRGGGRRVDPRIYCLQSGQSCGASMEGAASVPVCSLFWVSHRVYTTLLFDVGIIRWVFPLFPSMTWDFLLAKRKVRFSEVAPVDPLLDFIWRVKMHQSIK